MEDQQLDLINLCLSAGLNSKESISSFFEISIKTWDRWLSGGSLKRHQILALKCEAGMINTPTFQDYHTHGDRIYSPTGQFVHKHEIDNMWLYRLIKSTNGTKKLTYEPDSKKIPVESAVILEFKKG